MFLNFTNHSSAAWGKSQREAAQQYGPIWDLPFPVVPPAAESEELDCLAEYWAEHIAGMQPACVLCQGEMTLSYRVARRLLAQGIPVVAACSERHSREWTDPQGRTHREAEFAFVRFRPYDEPEQRHCPEVETGIQ